MSWDTEEVTSLLSCGHKILLQEKTGRGQTENQSCLGTVHFPAHMTPVGED